MRLVPKKREILILPFLTGSSVQETGGPDFFVSWESASYDTKTLCDDRGTVCSCPLSSLHLLSESMPAAEKNHAADAIRRKRRIIQIRIFLR